MPLASVLTFTFYLVAMLAIATIAFRRTDDLADYMLAGRRLGPTVTALSAGASDMSGWLLLGLPGAVYLGGLPAGWIGVGLVLGALLNWIYVSKELRTSTYCYDALTLPDYFEARFDDETRVLRLVSAFVILLFFTFYTASGLVAGAKLFSASFGWSYEVALWTGAVVIVAYTALGGFLAVSWTDVVQGLLMLLALIVVPATLVFEMGGLTSAFEMIEQVNPDYLSPTAGVSLISFLSLIAWGLGYFGQPHILARFMAISSTDELGTARIIGLGWMVMTLAGAICVGFLAIGYFSTFHTGVMTEANAEKVFIELTQLIFNPWIAGVLLAAILAAIMSTIDSQLLVSSSSLTEDFYKAWVRPAASQAELVWIGRLTVGLIALIAIFIAYDPDNQVLTLVSYAWAGLGASFGPVVLFSLYWQRMTRWGALAGMVVGALSVVIWKPLTGGWFDLYELLPAFLFSSCAIVIGSLMDRTPGVEMRAEFIRVKAMM